MNITLNWQENEFTSCLHAAQIAASRSDFHHPSLPPDFQETAKQVVREAEFAGISSKIFWRNAIPLSVKGISKNDLAEIIVRKAVPQSEESVVSASQISAAILSLSAIYEQAIPDARRQLELRRRPLEEAWEARGPGLMFALGRQLPEEFIPSQADGVLVLPVGGGRGTAHLSYNSFRIEGVLYNPHEELPEVVRIAWLIAQLNIDLPIYSETIPRDQLPLVARLAVLPGILAAAEEVDLIDTARCDLARALELWQVTKMGHETLAALVEQWWSVQSTREMPWHVALAALDQMLAEA